MPSPETALGVIAICLLLGVLAYKKKLLNLYGSIAAVFMGLGIGIMGHPVWILILLIFLVTSFGATRYRFEYKKKKNLQEGKKGERKARNVIANGIVPLAISVMVFEPIGILSLEAGSIIFLSAIAVAASDTLASELGMLYPNAYMITNFKKVTPGLNGAVSGPGTAWALVAAVYTGIVGSAFFYWVGIISDPMVAMAIPITVGFLGCQIDSVLGATLENKGYIGKMSNNLISIALGAIICWGILTWIV